MLRLDLWGPLSPPLPSPPLFLFPLLAAKPVTGESFPSACRKILTDTTQHFALHRSSSAYFTHLSHEAQREEFLSRFF